MSRLVAVCWMLLGSVVVGVLQAAGGEMVGRESEGRKARDAHAQCRHAFAALASLCYVIENLRTAHRIQPANVEHSKHSSGFKRQHGRRLSKDQHRSV